MAMKKQKKRNKAFNPNKHRINSLAGLNVIKKHQPLTIDEQRELVLNQRGVLAENGMTNDMVNDVLSEFDYYFHDIKCAVPPAPTNADVVE